MPSGDKTVELRLRTEADRASLSAAVGQVRGALHGLEAQAGKTTGASVAAAGGAGAGALRNLFIGGALAYGMSNAVKSAAEFSDTMNETSQKTGIASKDLQLLKFAAEQTGSSFEGAVTAQKFFATAIADARNGNETAAKKLAVLGLSVNDLSGNIASDMPKIAGAFQGLATDADRTAAAVDLFGRSGTGLIPMLREGAAGVEDLRRGFEEAGGAIDTMAGADAQDRLEALQTSFKNLKIRVGMAALPLLEEWMPRLTKVAATVGDITDKHGTLVLRGMEIGAGIWGITKAVQAWKASMEALAAVKALVLRITQQQAAAEGAAAGAGGGGRGMFGGLAGLAGGAGGAAGIGALAAAGILYGGLRAGQAVGSGIERGGLGAFAEGKGLGLTRQQLDAIMGDAQATIGGGAGGDRQAARSWLSYGLSYARSTAGTDQERLTGLEAVISYAQRESGRNEDMREVVRVLAEIRDDARRRIESANSAAFANRQATYGTGY